MAGDVINEPFFCLSLTPYVGRFIEIYITQTYITHTHMCIISSDIISINLMGNCPQGQGSRTELADLKECFP